MHSVNDSFGAAINALIRVMNHDHCLLSYLFILTAPPQKKGYRVVSFPIHGKCGRRASPSAYDDDSVKKRHNDMPIGNEVYLNKAPLGIEAPFLHCVMRHK